MDRERFTIPAVSASRPSTEEQGPEDSFEEEVRFGGRVPLLRSSVPDAGARRPIDCAVDPVFRIDGTIYICEFPNIGCVGRAWSSRFCRPIDNFAW